MSYRCNSCRLHMSFDWDAYAKPEPVRPERPSSQDAPAECSACRQTKADVLLGRCSACDEDN